MIPIKDKYKNEILIRIVFLFFNRSINTILET